MSVDTTYAKWAVIEILGHTKTGAFVTEVQLA